MTRAIGQQIGQVRVWARGVFVGMVALGVGLGAWTSVEAQTLTLLGTLGGNASFGYGISRDGRFAVGSARDGSQNAKAFLWQQNGSLQNLGALQGFVNSEAFGVSDNGSVVVGASFNTGNDLRAFRWTSGTGMQSLGTLGGSQSRAWSVSANGQVIVGEAQDTSGQWFPFRWTATEGMTKLSPQIAAGVAYDISADGSVVVGGAGGIAFRWNQGNIQNIGKLPGDSQSVAYGVSEDGNTVVGASFYTTEDQREVGRAFRWTAAFGLQALGPLDQESYAWAVSGDGQTIVGYAYNSENQPFAFRWTPANGMEDLNVAYANIRGNFIFQFAYDVSSDGRYIVGYGLRLGSPGQLEAFVLDTVPEPTSLTVMGVGLLSLLLRRRPTLVSKPTHN